MKKLIMVFASVASILVLCKPLYAEEIQATTNNKPESMPESIFDNFKLGGYGSAGITIPRTGDTEAALNEVSLLLTWNGNSRWSFFGELELENPLSWNDERQFNSKSSHLDLERLYLDYNFSENLNLRMGRFLTPNSRWNLLHASPLVWTDSRPLATYRLFPTGTNGLMLHGSKPLGEYAVDYMLFSEVLEDQEDDDFELGFEHVHGGRVALSKGWNIGVSLLSFVEKNVSGFGGKNQSYRMLGLDFVTDIGGAEISGEGFARTKSGGGDGGSGAYLQSAVPLSKLGLNNWFWLTRIETLQRPNEGNAERWLIGATWRAKPTQLLKLEFIGGTGDQPDAPRGFTASYALFF